MNPSVQPEWCLALPIQQQSVLLLAARGPDGIAKAHPCKDIQRAYRGTVLIAAKYGRSLHWGEKADTFMSLEKMVSMQEWKQLIDTFFQHADDLPHHFLMHLAHGAEILGYKHPDDRFKIRWKAFYFRCAKELHMTEESMQEMDARLSDWHCKHWGGPHEVQPVSSSEQGSTGAVSHSLPLEYRPGGPCAVSGQPDETAKLRETSNHMAACRALLKVTNYEVLYQAIKDQSEQLAAALAALRDRDKALIAFMGATKSLATMPPNLWRLRNDTVPAALAKQPDASALEEYVRPYREALKDAQGRIIRFLVAWHPHLDDTWVLHLMDAGRIDRDACGFFKPTPNDPLLNLSHSQEGAGKP